MGLEDAIGGEKEDKESDEDGPSYDGSDLQEYSDRLLALSRVMENMDGRIEEVQDDMESVMLRVRKLESAVGEVDSDTLADLYDKDTLQEALDQKEDGEDNLWGST